MDVFEMRIKRHLPKIKNHIDTGIVEVVGMTKDEAIKMVAELLEEHPQTVEDVFVQKAEWSPYEDGKRMCYHCAVPSDEFSEWCDKHDPEEFPSARCLECYELVDIETGFDGFRQGQWCCRDCVDWFNDTGEGGYQRIMRDKAGFPRC